MKKTRRTRQTVLVAAERDLPVLVWALLISWENL